MALTEPNRTSSDEPAALMTPLWSPRAIFWVGISGTFFFAGIMQSINFGRLRQPGKQRLVLLSTGIGFIGVLVGDYCLPTNPLARYPLIYLVFNGLISSTVAEQHASEFRRHRAAGGPIISIKKTILFAVLCSLIFIALALGFIIISDTWNQM